MISLEIAYASPTRQKLEKMIVPQGTTIEAAIRASHLLQDFPEIDLALNPVGIFSKRRHLSDLVSEGDRIEIYRPLTIDPNLARQKRAKKARIAARCKK